MADGTTNWLRPFSRSRASTPSLANLNSSNSNNTDQATPTTGSTASPTASAGPSTTKPQPQDRPHSSNHPYRIRPSGAIRHVSSLLNLKNRVSSSAYDDDSVSVMRASAPVAMLPLTEIDYGEADGFAFGSAAATAAAAEKRRVEGQAAWHNPNLMQMVETLQAVMMGKRDALVGLPVAYNSYVLALLEGFGHLTDELADAKAELGEVKKVREKELEEFRAMSEEWVQREEDYKKEVKRLELVLARESKDGMAAVALARHESVVDRAGSKRFQAKVKRVSDSQNQDTASKETGEPSGTQAQKPAETTAGYKMTGVPRILDPDNDKLVSHFLGQREIEEQRALLEQAPPSRLRHGRVRHTPAKTRESSDTLNRDTSTVPGRQQESQGAFRPELPTVRVDDFSRSRQERNNQQDAGNDRQVRRDFDRGQSSGFSISQPNNRPGPSSLPSFTTSRENQQRNPREVKRRQLIDVLRGNARQDTDTSRPRRELFGPTERSIFRAPLPNERPGPTAQQNLPTLQQQSTFTETLPQKPHGASSQGQGRRTRGYSFDKGDDKVLPTSPTWPLQIDAQPRSSGESATLVGDGEEAGRHEDQRDVTSMTSQNSTTSNNPDHAQAETPTPGAEHGALQHSNSTGSVIWVGNGESSARNDVDIDNNATSGEQAANGSTTREHATNHPSTREQN